MTMKFRVGVVTVVEVDAVDWRDAQNIAEGAVKYALAQVDDGDDKFGRIQWRHWNGHDYEATIVMPPSELVQGANLGYFHITVEQPTVSGTAGCGCACNAGGFCGGCGHAGCGGRRK